MSATSRTEAPDPEQTYRELIRCLDRSIESAPGDAQLLHRRARLYQRLAGHQWSLGKDASAAHRSSIESSEASIAADPSNEFALQALGDSLWDLAEHQVETGEDPTACCERAIRAYDRALALPPVQSAGSLWNGRCNVLRVLGEWLSDRGVEGAGGALERAVGSSQALTDLDLDLRSLYSAARAHLALATWRIRRGEHPGDSFEHVLRFPAILGRRIPNTAEAAWFWARQGDAMKRWRAAVEAFATALRAQADRPGFRELATRLSIQPATR